MCPGCTAIAPSSTYGTANGPCHCMRDGASVRCEVNWQSRLSSFHNVKVTRCANPQAKCWVYTATNMEAMLASGDGAQSTKMAEDRGPRAAKRPRHDRRDHDVLQSDADEQYVPFSAVQRWWEVSLTGLMSRAQSRYFSKKVNRRN